MPPDAALTSPDEIAAVVRRALDQTPILDVHTHLYSARFGPLLLWGVDELVTYHYLIAEVSRAHGGPTPGEFYALSTPRRADLIWEKLFLDSSPVSEAARGILTALKLLGIDVSERSLEPARAYFADVTVEQHIDTVFERANVRAAVMTNDPFDAEEREVWERGPEQDPRFWPALRIDGLLVNWDTTLPQLQSWGYDVDPLLDGASCREVRRFLGDWSDRMKPVYMAVSLSDDFAYPDDTPRTGLIRDCVLPVARDRGIPFAMMIGVRRQVNPALQLAGDGVGKFDTRSLERICVENPDVKFLVTLLSRENQHEFCVAARKLPNLMPFGCWWFLNDPSLIEEITRMRLELLGLSMIPQHSDCRVLDQLVYKWAHSRHVIGKVLTDKYSDLAATGWPLTEADIGRDVANLMDHNFTRFVGV